MWCASFLFFFFLFLFLSYILFRKRFLVQESVVVSVVNRLTHQNHLIFYVPIIRKHTPSTPIMWILDANTLIHKPTLNAHTHNIGIRCARETDPYNTVWIFILRILHYIRIVMWKFAVACRLYTPIHSTR